MELIFKNRERRRYGSGEPSRMVNTAAGKVFIPSEGALDKQEMEYLTEAAKEKGAERRTRDSETKAVLNSLTQVALQTPPGQRSRTLRTLIEESKRRRE